MIGTSRLGATARNGGLSLPTCLLLRTRFCKRSHTIHQLHTRALLPCIAEPDGQQYRLETGCPGCNVYIAKVLENLFSGRVCSNSHE